VSTSQTFLVFLGLVDKVEPEISLTSEGDGMAHGGRMRSCIYVFVYCNVCIGVTRFWYWCRTVWVLQLHLGVWDQVFLVVGPCFGVSIIKLRDSPILTVMRQKSFIDCAGYKTKQVVCDT